MACEDEAPCLGVVIVECLVYLEDGFGNGVDELTGNSESLYM